MPFVQRQQRVLLLPAPSCRPGLWLMAVVAEAHWAQQLMLVLLLLKDPLEAACLASHAVPAKEHARAKVDGSPQQHAKVYREHAPGAAPPHVTALLEQQGQLEAHRRKRVARANMLNSLFATLVSQNVCG